MVESAATSSTSLALDWAYFDLADVKGDFLTLPALLNEPPLDEQVALLPPLLGAVTMNWSDSVCEAKDELLDASEDLSGEERFEPEMLLARSVHSGSELPVESSPLARSSARSSRPLLTPKCR